MRIYVNARQALSDQKTGKAVYSQNLIANLKAKKDLKLTLLDQGFSSKLGLWHILTALKVRRDKPDIYFDPESFITPFFVSLLTKSKVVVTVHDLVAFKFSKGHFLKAILIERLFLPLLVKRKNVSFFCVSNFTKDQFIKHFKVDKSRVFITPLGYESEQKPQKIKRKHVSKIRSQAPKIVCISTFLERKNQLSLVYEFSLIKDEIPHNLYLVGGGNIRYVNKVKNLITELNLQDRVFITGFISNEEKNKLIKEAEFTVYPSLYEGFGIPLLESLSLGTPVITTKRTVMQEVLQDAAIYFDPKKTTDLAFQIKFLAGNHEQQDQLLENAKKIIKKYTWTQTAASVYKAFKSLK